MYAYIYICMGLGLKDMYISISLSLCICGDFPQIGVLFDPIKIMHSSLIYAI